MIDNSKKKKRGWKISPFYEINFYYAATAIRFLKLYMV